MRWLVLALTAVLLVPAPASGQRAWVKAYDDGVELFEKGNNDALAESKLVEARDRGPRQSRRHNFSSVDYRPFIPDLYLGLIYVRTGRLKLGQEYLERAIQQGLIKPDDKTYQLASAGLERVREEQARLARNTPRPNPTDVVKPPVTSQAPASTTPTPTNPNAQTPATNAANTATPPTVRPTPPPVTPPANVEPAWLPAFRRSMEAAGASLRQSRYAEARSSVTSAAALAGDAARRAEAETLRRNIDTAQNIEADRVADRANAALRRKDVDAALTQVAWLENQVPGHGSLPGLRKGIESLRGALRGMADLAQVERRGVRLFLSGNYKLSATELQRAIGDGVTSPRIYLFLASSRAAEALLAPQSERPALEAEARKAYAQAKPGAAALVTDKRFISPSILRLLDGG